MIEPTENVAKIGKTNIALFPQREGMNFSNNSVPVQKDGIIESGNEKEDFVMPQDTYSKTEIDLKLEKTSSDVQHGFDKVDLKFENLEQKMDAGFKQIDLKFNNFEDRIANLLLTQENKRLEEQAKNKKEFMYWAIGIIVAIASIAFPLWFGK